MCFDRRGRTTLTNAVELEMN